MTFSRRQFLKNSLAVSMGFGGLAAYAYSGLTVKNDRELRPVKDLLQLPEGFTYTILSQWGEKMSDGLLVPGRADGMAAFARRGKVVLIRNHENSPGENKDGAFGKQLELLGKIGREKFFDFGFGKTPGLGGTTTVVLDEKSLKVERQYLSLAGTYRNCAGGPTPWNSWITCEEDTAVKGTVAEMDHGYNFEVPVQASGLVTPVPLRAMGRFNHEAVCVDPRTGIVYQTEDRGDSLVYRFIPRVQGRLHEGGILQALVLRDARRGDTRNWETTLMERGRAFDVEWITMDDVESAADDLRLRGHAAGAALFARGEGMWFGNGEVYFACTNGGKRKAGQVFRYVPSPYEGTAAELSTPGKLTLFAESADTDILKYCDNLTVAPWGDVILVEDSSNSYIRGITPEGRIYNIGRNVGSSSELAGVCFSPSGQTMFVNIQGQGLTLAIRGPWERLPRA